MRIFFLLVTFVIFSCDDYPDQQTIAEHPKEKFYDKKINEVALDLESKINNTIWDSIEKKASWFIQNKTIHFDMNNIPQDFNLFYDEFIQDSVIQKDHIDFSNLIGVYIECDTTIRVVESNWEYFDWDFRNFINDPKNTNSQEEWSIYYYFDKDKFYFKIDLNEVGTIYEVGFEKEPQWKMTLFTVNNC